MSAKLKTWLSQQLSSTIQIIGQYQHSTHTNTNNFTKNFTHGTLPNPDADHTKRGSFRPTCYHIQRLTRLLQPELHLANCYK
jgi:hypothetical protein